MLHPYRVIISNGRQRSAIIFEKSHANHQFFAWAKTTLFEGEKDDYKKILDSPWKPSTIPQILRFNL
jgi:hypothetical protein